jgi:hypothetical protein
MPHRSTSRFFAALITAFLVGPASVAFATTGFDTPPGSSYSPFNVEGVEGMRLVTQNATTGPIYLGIGTPSPQAVLHVYQASSATYPTFESGTGINFIRLLSHNGGGNYGSSILFNDGSTASAQISSIASGGLWFGTAGSTSQVVIDASGNVGIATTAPGQKLEVAGAVIFSNVPGALELTATPTGATFWTNASYSAGSPFSGWISTMTLSNGNVGVGMTTPNGRLDILAPGGYASPIIQLRQSNASAYGVNMGIDNSFDGGLVFSAVNNGTATPIVDVDRTQFGVVIGANYVEAYQPPSNGLIVQGNVGIGVTNPIGTLDIENGANTATLCLNGTCTQSLPATPSVVTSSVQSECTQATTGVNCPSGQYAISGGGWCSSGGGFNHYLYSSQPSGSPPTGWTIGCTYCSGGGCSCGTQQAYVVCQ